jgi:hypothetical protein
VDEAPHKNKGSTSKRKDPTRCGRGHDLGVPGNSRHNIQNGKPYLECKVCACENAAFRGKLMSPEKRAKVIQAFARKARFETIKRFCDTIASIGNVVAIQSLQQLTSNGLLAIANDKESA